MYLSVQGGGFCESGIFPNNFKPLRCAFKQFHAYVPVAITRRCSTAPRFSFGSTLALHIEHRSNLHSLSVRRGQADVHSVGFWEQVVIFLRLVTKRQANVHLELPIHNLFPPQRVLKKSLQKIVRKQQGFLAVLWHSWAEEHTKTAEGRAVVINQTQTTRTGQCGQQSFSEKVVRPRHPLLSQKKGVRCV